MDGSSSLLHLEGSPVCSAVVRETNGADATLHPKDSTSTCDAFAGDAYTDDGIFPVSSDLETSFPFSIRGYVAAVREFDIKRCWPFSRHLLEQSIKAGKTRLLPSLSPFGCVVRLQTDFLDGVQDHAAACEVDCEPQLQVQIDVSRCNLGSPIDTKLQEPPGEGELSITSTQATCCPQKMQAQTHCIPYLGEVLAFKRQAPRGIQEIRESIMEECECSRSVENEFCNKQICMNSEIRHDPHQEKPNACAEGDSTKSRNDAEDVGETENVAIFENVSAITDLEASRKGGDTGQDPMVIGTCNEDDRHNTSSKIHDDAIEADAPLILSSVVRSQSENVYLGKEPSPSGQLESRPSVVGSFDFQNGSKSSESQSSKHLNVNPCGSDIVSTQEDELESGSGQDATPQQRCPVCAHFQCSSNTALNAHMDGCLAMTFGGVSEKTKGKAQRGKVRKKRSMAELCQLSPPCENMNGIPSPGLSNKSLREEEDAAIDFHERKKTKLQPEGVDNTSIVPSKSERSKKHVKSQAQALQFLRWRSRSASSSRDLHFLQGSKRSKLPEASPANFNKSRLENRKLEIKRFLALRKNQCKPRKIIHDPYPQHELLKQEIQQLKKHIPTERRGKGALQNNGSSIQSTHVQIKTPLDSKKVQNSSFNMDGPEVSISALPRKQKPLDQTAHVQTSETVVTVKGSHETTFKFLRADEATVEELNEPRKIRLRVHVKPQKKRSKQKITLSMPQNKHSSETIVNVDTNDNPKDWRNQTKSRHFKRTLQGRSVQTNLLKNKKRNLGNLRRLAEKISIPGLQFPLLSSAILARQAEQRFAPVAAVSCQDQGLCEQDNHPAMTNAERSTIKDTSRGFTKINDLSLFSHNDQTRALKNHSDGCAARRWHSFLNKTLADTSMKYQKAQASHTLASTLPQCKGASAQRQRLSPFSLGANELSQCPQSTPFSRANYQLQSEQISKLARMLGVSNRSCEFVAGKQIPRPGTEVSFQPETSQITGQVNQPSQIQSNHLRSAQGFELDANQTLSARQTLPAWMQSTIHERRPSAMPSMESPTSSVGPFMLNTAPNAGRETSSPSNMIGNHVLRLMGKTMAVMPEAHRDQVGLTSTHLPSSSKYIDFFRMHEFGDGGHKQHWNEGRVHHSDTSEGMPH